MVRSFAALAILENGTLADDTEDVKIRVCDLTFSDGNDTLAGDAGDAVNATNATSCGSNDIIVEPPAIGSNSSSDPDYVVNSLVDIDGGTGTDRLTVVGTEVSSFLAVPSGGCMWCLF